MKKERNADGFLTVAALSHGGVEQQAWRDGDYTHIVKMSRLRPVPPDPVLYRVEHRLVHHGATIRATSHVELTPDLHEARQMFTDLRTDPPTYYDHSEEKP